MRTAALRWCGSGLAAVGLIAIAAVAFLPALRENPFIRWILMETLAPVRVLPLIGLGAAFGLIGLRALIAALVLLAIGIAGGLFAEDWLLWMLDAVPRAATHQFLTDPISYLAAGTTLVSSARLRPYVAPAAAAIFGAMLGVTIKLTDPSLHDPAFTWTPVLIAFWIVAAVSLPLHTFWRSWSPIFGRVLGSWLIAIGCLYGAASLMPQHEPLPQIAPTPEFDQPYSSDDQLNERSKPDALPERKLDLRQP
jgi:hypothetical protein